MHCSHWRQQLTIATTVAALTSCVGGGHNMLPPPPRKLTFDLESGVRVTCDVGYLYANFNLPRPLCSQLRPDIRDRQTDVRRAASLNASALWGRGVIRNERISLITHRQRMQYLSALERPMSLIYRTAKRNENVLLLPAKQRCAVYIRGRPTGGG